MTHRSEADVKPQGSAPRKSASPFSSAPASSLVPWMNAMSRLASLTRFSMERLSCRESVLEHLGQVALTSYALAAEAIDRGADLKLEDCVAKALVHDLEELITGDVARPTKHSSPQARRLFDDLSKKSVEVLREEMNYFPTFAADMERKHKSAKLGQSGFVVAMADVLAVVTKVWEETILRGNGAMIRQAYTAQAQISSLRDRAADQFDGDAWRFFDSILVAASELMEEARSRDLDVFGTKVERY